MADSGEKKENGKEREAGQDDHPKAPDLSGLIGSGHDDTTAFTADRLASLMNSTLSGLLSGGSGPKPEQLLSEVSYEGLVKYIKEGKCKNIITMAGAGISTSAGIPDFRSPGTGLYDNLAKYDLPSPQAIFEINFFKENPAPFFTLAKELYPGVFKPTVCHYFIRLLHEKGLLLRHYTQNIDTLERVSGLPDDKLVEAHGTFATAHCIECRKQFEQQWVKEKVFADEIPKCTLEECDGVVKPDIVFFGESLPTRFVQCVGEDFDKCDLLIILGTSLAVQPFASLVDNQVNGECHSIHLVAMVAIMKLMENKEMDPLVPETTPRLYINLEKCEPRDPWITLLMGGGAGFNADAEDNYRDIFWQGTCDDGCLELSNNLGWKTDLKKMTETEQAKIDAQNSKSTDADKGAAGKL